MAQSSEIIQPLLLIDNTRRHMALHPKKDDKGKPVSLLAPSTPTYLGTWADAGATAQVVPGGPMPPKVGQLKVASWAPASPDAWEEMAAAMDLTEPPLVTPNGLPLSAGVVTVEPDGRVWPVAPSNALGGCKVMIRRPSVSSEASALPIGPGISRCGTTAKVGKLKVTARCKPFQ